MGDNRLKRFIVFLVGVSLVSAFLAGVTVSSPSYNPWLDVNDDGAVDITDIAAVIAGYGMSGEPVAKATLEYDSGWIDITDKAGQNILVAHGFSSMDVIVDITGRTTVDGGIHQKQIGGEDYTETWNQTYGGTDYDGAYSVVQTVDGGYALAGATNSYGAGSWDFWLVKTDAAGNALWSKTYGGTGEEYAWSVVQTVDGGYALAGATNSSGAGSWDFWLVKTDASGNALWNQTYGGTDYDEAWSVVQTVDGGYALAGYTTSYSTGWWEADFWLVKTDAAGNALWSKTYGGTSDDACYSMIVTGDGGYALAGHTYSFDISANGDFWLVKTDASGNALWNQTYGGTDYERGYSLVQTIDGGYALVGQTYSYGAGGSDSWLIKTDAAGNHVWNQTYGGTGEEGAWSVVQTVDGGYALVGYTNSSGAGNRDSWLVKTDASGNALWSQTYGGTDNEGAVSVIQAFDGGYALAGSTNSYGAGSRDFWLVKTDSYGNMLAGLFKYGLAWIDSTLDSITLYRGTHDSYWNFVRVRIWQIKETP